MFAKTYKLILLLVLGVMFSGCGASLSQKDCAGTDWLAKGQSDALDGKEIKAFYDYQSTCKGMGVAADEATYVKGYLEGQKTYCVYDQGYSMGNKGGRLTKSCPAKSQFYDGYVAGRLAYQERHEKRSADNITRSSGSLGAGPTGGP